MQFTDIDLEDFRCFDDTSVRFENGVVAVHGSNGAGKSSLLEGIFFTLYGSNALPSGVTLEDVLTTGEREASATLNFRHDGTRYKLTREIRRRSDRASNTKSVLRADGPIVADGARDVTSYVSDLLHMDADAFVNCAYIRQGGVTKLINASPSERQAMIDDLLQLGTLEDYRERASKARIGTGRVRDTQAGNVDELETQIEEKENQNLKQQQKNAAQELARINAAIDDIEERREEAVERRDDALKMLDAHEERIERIEDIDETVTNENNEIIEAINNRDELKLTLYKNGTGAATARSHIRTALTTDEKITPTDGIIALSETDIDTEDPTVTTGIAHDRSGLQARIEKTEKREDEATDASAEAKETQRRAGETATSYEGDAVNAAESAATKRERISDLNDKIQSDTKTIEKLEDEIEDEEEAVEGCKDNLDEFGYGPKDTEGTDKIHEEAADQTTRLNERIETVQTDIGAAQGHISRATNLRDEGRCPECGQSVDDSPHVTRLNDEQRAVEYLKEKNKRLRDERNEMERVAELADELATHRDFISDREDELSEIQNERNDKRERVSELKKEVDRLNEQSVKKYQKARSKRAEAAEAAETVEELESKRKLARERASRLRNLNTTLSNLTSAVSAVEDTIRERNDLMEETNERRGEIHKLARERVSLQSEVNTQTIEQVREAVEHEKGQIDCFDRWDDKLRGMRDGRQQTLGQIEGAISDLEQLRERRNEAAEREDRLEDFYEEMESLEAMYDDVRSDLRQRNIDHLQRIMNDIFNVLYRNDAYAGIELDDNYAFTVHEKGGNTLDPTQLSGGEQVLFNLSLRCAIYKLLAQGVRGSGSMPPLILDEPTAHLDTGHVNQLSNIVDIMRELGVSQTIIVSHDDEIVDSADGEVHLIQDSTTNRSTVAMPGVGGVPPVSPSS